MGGLCLLLRSFSSLIVVGIITLKYVLSMLHREKTLNYHVFYEPCVFLISLKCVMNALP